MTAAFWSVCGTLTLPKAYSSRGGGGKLQRAETQRMQGPGSGSALTPTFHRTKQKMCLSSTHTGGSADLSHQG